MTQVLYRWESITYYYYNILLLSIVLIQLTWLINSCFIINFLLNIFCILLCQCIIADFDLSTWIDHISRISTIFMFLNFDLKFLFYISKLKHFFEAESINWYLEFYIYIFLEWPLRLHVWCATLRGTLSTSESNIFLIKNWGNLIGNILNQNL